jgi:predicted nuclease of predicted toxin-antitoxin system
MKLLLDQGLPRSTVQHLASVGIVAEHIGDLGMARADDDAIMEEARRRGATVVTLDADFHQTLAVSRARSPSVVRVRMEGLKGIQLAAIIEKVMLTAGAELAAGALVSITPGRMRVRTLPIGR